MTERDRERQTDGRETQGETDRRQGDTGRDREMTGRDRVTKVGGRDGYREMWRRADSNREGRAGG